MARRRKPLSEEDQNLWKKVTLTVDPLFLTAKFNPPGLVQNIGAPTKVLAENRKSALKIARALPPSHMKGAHHSGSSVRSHSILPTHNSIDHKTRKKITRGRMPIDARIDLHGMNQNRAISVLRDFLYQAHAEDYRLILIITGKGEGGAGILRRRVPDWLSSHELAPMISGFQEAHISHGGSGALYVRLRRQKRF